MRLYAWPFSPSLKEIIQFWFTYILKQYPDIRYLFCGIHWDEQIEYFNDHFGCCFNIYSATLFVTEINSDLDIQQIQINNIVEEVDALDTQVMSLEENDFTQDVRLDIVEDDVDEWDDKITALEVANVDIQQRLKTVEEHLLGEIYLPEN